jgi:hypothetical protein
LAQQPPSYKTVFVFLDTDKYCSPFDMLVAIDAFPDSMIFKYENVTSEDAPKIVFDLLFPRGPEGAKHTKVFINGSNFEMVEKVVEATQTASSLTQEADTQQPQPQWQKHSEQPWRKASDP